MPHAVVFLLYEPIKGTALSRDGFERLLVDSNVLANNDGLRGVEDFDSWLEDMNELTSLQLTNIFAQFGSSKDKMTFPDFLAYMAQDRQPPEDTLPYILKVLEL